MKKLYWRIYYKVAFVLWIKFWRKRQRDENWVLYRQWVDGWLGKGERPAQENIADPEDIRNQMFFIASRRGRNG